MVVGLFSFLFVWVGGVFACFLPKVYILLWSFGCVSPTYLPAYTGTFTYTGTLAVCSISHLNLNFHATNLSILSLPIWDEALCLTPKEH